MTSRREHPRPAGAIPMSASAVTEVTCILPVKDMARARRFYDDSLGLSAGAAKPEGKFV